MRMRSPGLWGVRGGARRGCSCWTCAHLLGAWVLPHLLDQRAEVGVELLRACQQPGTRAHTVHRRRPGVNSRVCECGRDVHLRVGPPSSRLPASYAGGGEGRCCAAGPQTGWSTDVAGLHRLRRLFAGCVRRPEGRHVPLRSGWMGVGGWLLFPLLPFFSSKVSLSALRSPGMSQPTFAKASISTFMLCTVFE